MMLVYLTGITFSHEPNTFEVQLIVDGTLHQSLVRVEVDERSFPGRSIQVAKGDEYLRNLLREHPRMESKVYQTVLHYFNGKAIPLPTSLDDSPLEESYSSPELVRSKSSALEE
jgi:hypothetical protein